MVLSEERRLLCVGKGVRVRGVLEERGNRRRGGVVWELWCDGKEETEQKEREEEE